MTEDQLAYLRHRLQSEQDRAARWECAHSGVRIELRDARDKLAAQGAACERMANAIDAVRNQHFSTDDNVFNPDSYTVPAYVVTELFAALDSYDERDDPR